MAKDWMLFAVLCFCVYGVIDADGAADVLEGTFHAVRGMFAG
jgi:hypothetical protein